MQSPTENMLSFYQSVFLALPLFESMYILIQNHRGMYNTFVDADQRIRSRPSSAHSSSASSTYTSNTDLSSTPSLCDNLDTRRQKMGHPIRIKSAPPLRQAAFTVANPLPPPQPPCLSRRRSFTGSGQSYPSRGEMLKTIFTVFPTPQPQGVNRRASRPSSAVALRAGRIPHLRNK